MTRRFVNIKKWKTLLLAKKVVNHAKTSFTILLRYRYAGFEFAQPYWKEQKVGKIYIERAFFSSYHIHFIRAQTKIINIVFFSQQKLLQPQNICWRAFCVNISPVWFHFKMSLLPGINRFHIPLRRLKDKALPFNR